MPPDVPSTVVPVPSNSPEEKKYIAQMNLLDMRVNSDTKVLDASLYTIRNLKDGELSQDAATVNQLTNLNTDLSDRIGIVEGRATDVEGRATAVEGRVTKTETDISDLKERASDGESYSSGLNSRLTTAEDGIGGHGVRLSLVEGRATDVEGRVANVEGRAGTAESDIAGIKDNVYHGTKGNTVLDTRLVKVESVIDLALSDVQVDKLLELTSVIKGIDQDVIDMNALFSQGFANDATNATNLTSEVSRALGAEAALTNSLNTLRVMDVILDVTNPAYTADGAVVQAVPVGKGVISGAYFKSKPQTTDNSSKSKINFYVPTPSNTKFTNLEFMSSTIQLINTDANSIPYFVVYTRNPTLSVQTNVWYNSKRMFLYTGTSLNANIPYQFFANIQGFSDNSNLLKSVFANVELTYVAPVFDSNGIATNAGYSDYKNPGLLNDNEELLYATLQTSSQLSSAQDGAVEMIFSNIVTQYNNSISTNFLMDGAALSNLAELNRALAAEELLTSTIQAEIARSIAKDVELQDRSLGTSKTLKSLVKFLLGLDIDLEEANGFEFIQQ